MVPGGTAMIRPGNIAFVITAAIAVSALPVITEAGPGDHYTTVVHNHARQCNSLSGQFARARSSMADTDQLRLASALYEQGVGHCRGGAQLRGIEELSQAIQIIAGN